MNVQPDAINAVLSQYDLSDCQVSLLEGGLINKTYAVTQYNGLDPNWILQRVNPIFDPAIHNNIADFIPLLHKAEVPVPHLKLTKNQQKYWIDADGFCWRVISYIHGSVHSRFPSIDHCFAAGEMTARLHQALADYTQPLHWARDHVHDVEFHVIKLKQALEKNRDHPAYSEVSLLSEKLFEAVGQYPILESLDVHIVHGDLKCANWIFKDLRVAAIIDLDTFNRLPWAVELGDALRSWCTVSDNSKNPSFSLERFQAALSGYTSSRPEAFSSKDARAIFPWTVLISTELAIRFATDALEESYFGWDSHRFSHAWEHNLVRANAQWSVSQSLINQAEAAMEISASLFGSK